MDRCGETADLKPCRRSCSEHTRRSCAEQSQRSVLTGVLGIAVLALVGALARPPCTSDSSALSTKPEYWELPADSNLSLAHDHQASAIFPPDSSQHADHSSPLILVAGLSRTGTSSVQQALSLLNLTVFHTHETMRHHLDFWYYYLDGKISQPDVRALIDPLGVQAISDCWFAYLAPEIIRAYPSAKVILGTRDVLSWLRSYNSYIDSSDLYHWGRQLRRLVLSRTSRVLQLGPTLRSAGLVASEGGLDLEKLPILMHVWRRIDKVVYGTNTPNPLWRSAFERHNAYIRSLVPSDQILEFNIGAGHGWREIVDFLGVDSATADQLLMQPFPRLNCVASKSCVSHLSAQTTAKHEKLTVLCAALLFSGLAIFCRGCFMITGRKTEAMAYGIKTR